MYEEIQPFVKWIGSKRRVVDKLKEHLPVGYNLQEGSYYEPFVGSGAMMLALRPANAVINDLNPELTLTYKVIRDNKEYQKMLNQLREWEKEHTEELYYKIRDMDRKPSYVSVEDYIHAARLIYLNKTCYNGLYRTNRKGEFNAPCGHKEKVKLFDRKNLNAVHEYLSSNDITIFNGDYGEVIRSAKEGDFVYLDPPYDGTFNKYTAKSFGEKDQKKLAETFYVLANRGVNVMLTNSNTELINSLYVSSNKKELKVRHIVSPKGESRKECTELVITSY